MRLRGPWLRVVSTSIVMLTAMACGGGGGDDGASSPDGASRDDAIAVEGGGDHDGAVDPDVVTPLEGGSDTAPNVDSGPIVASQPISEHIVVDQLGYPTSGEKIAVVRDPQKGFDASSHFTPGGKYALVDAHTGAKVLEAAPVAWKGGATDESSGDKAWWFDFSSVTRASDYFVLDEAANVRSDVFRIADDVYRDVLAQSIRMFYYQRDGIAKDAKYAGANWADGAAHMGPLQGPNCGLYTDGSAQKDLHGGWYDAGDLNKYTNWGADDVIVLMRAYAENPSVFFDDYNIPESGNGVADVLDETKWELDWLVRMQNADGSVLSIVGQDGVSTPAFGGSKNTAPSGAKGPCKYGPATTSATFSSAAAFARAAKVYKPIAAYASFADELATRAKSAWAWAEAHPAISFANSGKVGAGEQEVDDKGRAQKKLQAAVFLFDLTGEPKYRDYVDTNYKSVGFISSGYVDMFAVSDHDALLDYTKIAGATPGVVADIKAKYKSGAASDNNLGSLKSNPDPYLAYLYVYTWGSNQIKAEQGNLLYDVVTYGIDGGASADAIRGGARYLHYLHGVNPLQLVYLSSMNDHGANKSVTRFFHSWFANGSDWDAVGVSKYGPPPGFLTGGPNPSYAWDGCCPGGCSGFSCGSAPPSPPTGQPPQKAYKDFNDNWPLDSWAVTEPDDGYQAKYVRLLSKYVK